MENTNDIKVNNIIAEVNADDFCKTTEKKSVQNIQRAVNTNKVNKEEKKQCKMDNKTKMFFAKTIALAIATGVCGYLKLMSPILYIPIELVCVCAGCFKLGEYKGKNYGRAE